MTVKKRLVHSHTYAYQGNLLRNIILGGQDGLVNVLGSVLGVAAATNDSAIVIIAGVVATLAESISMGAVAYTSSKASHDFYTSQISLERDSIKKLRNYEISQIRDLYKRKGFSGKQLNSIVKKITDNKELWVKTIMDEEINLTDDFKNPIRHATIVFVAAFLGSLVPLIPFLVMPVKVAIGGSFIISTTALFALGAVKGRITFGDWKKSGAELAIIGIIAAIAAYLIGIYVGRVILHFY